MGKQIRVFSIIGLVSLLLAACGGPGSSQSKIDYTLTTDQLNGQMVYVGVGGGIDGVVNPMLIAPVNSVVTVKLINGDDAQHNINFPDFNTTSGIASGKGSSVTVIFGVDKAGVFPYYSNLPGQQEAGMKGEIDVEGTTRERCE